jgi:hypothetical protein
MIRDLAGRKECVEFEPDRGEHIRHRASPKVVD